MYPLLTIKLQRALRLRERTLGPNHMIVAQTLNNLANLYTRSGKYNEATELYYRAADITRDIYGIDHPDFAQTQHNLGNLLLKRGRHDEALKQYQRALDIALRVYGESHFFVDKIRRKMVEASGGPSFDEQVSALRSRESSRSAWVKQDGKVFYLVTAWDFALGKRPICYTEEEAKRIDSYVNFLG